MVRAPSVVAPPPVDLSSKGPRVTRLSEHGWVKVRLSHIYGEEESLAQARTKALAGARASASEFLSGTTVRCSVLSFESLRDQKSSELIEVLFSVFSECWWLTKK